MDTPGTQPRVWRAAFILLVLAGCGPDRASTAPAAAAPARIVSVTLATDEMLADMVDPARVVAVSRYVDDRDYSNAAGRFAPAIARVTSNVESIIGLRPDLVCVASYNSPDFLELLARSGLRTHRNGEVDSLEKVAVGLVRLGEAVAAPERAARLAADMRARLAKVDAQVAHRTARPRVLYWEDGYVAGSGSTIGEIIERAGGRNVGAEIGVTGVQPVAIEKVLGCDPDTLLVGRSSTSDAAAKVKQEPLLARLRAVREDRVVTVDARLLSSVSHHVAGAVEQLALALEPPTAGAGEKAP